MEDHHVLFLLRDIRDGVPLRTSVFRSQCSQTPRGDVSLTHSCDQGAHLGGETLRSDRFPQFLRPGDGAVFQASHDQFADPLILLGARQQARRIDVLLSAGVRTNQAVGERMEGGDHGQQATTDARCDPVPNLSGRPPSERQDQHFLRGLPGLQAPHNGFDDRGGLAGAWPREHQERPVAVIDHRLLAGVELEGVRPRQGR